MSNCIYKIRCLANNINSYQAKATDEEEEKEEEEIFIDLEDEDLEDRNFAGPEDTLQSSGRRRDDSGK